MVDMAHIAGLVAAGVHPTPVGIADLVTTTIHKTLGGPRGGHGAEHRRSSATEGRPGRLPRPPGRPADARHRRQGRRARATRSRPSSRRARSRPWPTAGRSAAELVAGGLALVSGGTDNHLVLVDLSATAAHRRGRRGAAATAPASRSTRTACRSTSGPPTVTSGLRIGTAALTTRGLREDEMREIGQIIVAALREPRSPTPSSRRCAPAPARSVSASRSTRASWRPRRSRRPHPRAAPAPGRSAILALCAHRPVKECQAV